MSPGSLVICNCFQIEPPEAVRSDTRGSRQHAVTSIRGLLWLFLQENINFCNQQTALSSMHLERLSLRAPAVQSHESRQGGTEIGKSVTDSVRGDTSSPPSRLLLSQAAYILTHQGAFSSQLS